MTTRENHRGARLRDRGRKNAQGRRRMRIGAPSARNRGVAPIADWRSGRFPQGGCRCPGGPGKDVYDLTSATSTVPRTPGRTTAESAATRTSSFAGHGNRARSTVRQKIDAYFAFLEQRYAQLRPMIHIAPRSLFRAGCRWGSATSLPPPVPRRRRTREQAQAMDIDMSRRSTSAECGFCTFQPVVDGGACP
ncbi:hypothetical protein [Streptomyces sp. NBC_01794]|uniref:hypothetical protein n=1 Tax=Streptomyces sp. NBC_01794 TaxID=2975942 RepID=UPI00308D3C74|nr:hypothetical protein OIE54_02345 [Streptomyces sp. NBC_01794]